MVFIQKTKNKQNKIKQNNNNNKISYIKLKKYGITLVLYNTKCSKQSNEILFFNFFDPIFSFINFRNLIILIYNIHLIHFTFNIT